MEVLAGKVAVVTGGASGIGLALAEVLAARGMRLVLADVENAALAAACDSLREDGAEVLGVPTDVTRWTDVAALADRTLGHYGEVHVVCNNAGVSLLGPTWELTLDDWRWVLDVNLWGVIHGIRAFVPILRRQGQPAHVVNTASLASFLPLGTHAPYCVSKSGVAMLSVCLHQELAAEGAPVRVSAVCPGMVDTRIHRSNRNRPAGDQVWSTYEQEPEYLEQSARVQGAGIPPADVAEAILDAIRTGQFWVLTHPDATPVIGAEAERIVRGENPEVRMPGDIWGR